MRVYIKKHDNLQVPKRAHCSDTGFDIYSISDPIVHGDYDEKTNSYKSIDYIEYKTGVYLNLMEDEVNVYVNIRPRSSLRKYNLLLCNSVGLVDAGYTGELIVSFKYIFQPIDIWYFNSCKINYDKIYKKGDKIAQLEFIRGNEYVEFVPVSEETFSLMENTSTRKDAGHGSTTV